MRDLPADRQEHEREEIRQQADILFPKKLCG
jgi:hypothetical protein